MKTGYATVTYKMKLTCKRLDWLQETKLLYNRVRAFYHALLQEHTELHGLGSQAMLRELEKLSLTGRSGERPPQPLPYENVSAYFRRSAANGAIGAYRTYLQNHESWEKERTGAVKAGKAFRRTEPRPAEGFQSSPTFYKGMYKDFTESSITLKLWTGAGWAWVRCRYRGRPIPQNAELLSPTVVVHKKQAMLHISVKLTVEDIRPVKERVRQGAPVCSVAFTNSDAFAVCSLQQVDGRTAASRFIRGGAEYVHHSKRLLERIRSNRKVLGKHFDWTGCNKRYWEHLNHLSDYWAHKASREIVDFCRQQGAKTIALMEPNYPMMKAIAGKAGKYSPIYLSLRIRRYLAYKAWKEGIAVTMVKPAATTKQCSVCGHTKEKRNRSNSSEILSGRAGAAPETGRSPNGYSSEALTTAMAAVLPAAALLISKEGRPDSPSAEAERNKNQSANMFVCPNGHQINRNLNTARNIGKSCLHRLGSQLA